MHRVDTGHAESTGSRRHGRVVVIGAAVVALFALGACTSKSATDQTGSGPTGSVSSPTQYPDGAASAPTSKAVTPPAAQPALAAAITLLPAAGAKTVDPAKPVVVKVAHGTLSSVTMTNPAGKTVKGALSADRSSWTSTEELGYAKTYRIVARARTPPASRSSSTSRSPR